MVKSSPVRPSFIFRFLPDVPARASQEVNGLSLHDVPFLRFYLRMRSFQVKSTEYHKRKGQAKVVKLFGIVRSEGSFTEQHLVMNGASDLIAEVFEARGSSHARSAIGTNTLPLGIAVEVEAIVKLKER